MSWGPEAHWHTVLIFDLVICTFAFLQILRLFWSYYVLQMKRYSYWLHGNPCLSKMFFLWTIMLLTFCQLTQLAAKCSPSCFFLVKFTFSAFYCPCPTFFLDMLLLSNSKWGFEFYILLLWTCEICKSSDSFFIYILKSILCKYHLSKVERSRNRKWVVYCLLHFYFLYVWCLLTQLGFSHTTSQAPWHSFILQTPTLTSQRSLSPPYPFYLGHTKSLTLFGIWSSLTPHLPVKFSEHFDDPTLQQ